VIQEEVNQKYAFLKHLTEFGEHGIAAETPASE
jgi:hypothetical protein